jgi:hypothetical protein
MYLYYPFQLALPLVLLWLALVIDKPDKQMKLPVWFKIVLVLNASIAILTMTNEMHFLVFPLYGLTPSGSVEHGYGIGYYAVLACTVLPVFMSVIILLIKSRGSIRKTGSVFALAFIIILAAYGYGYLNRIPIAWDSDRTMVIGLFTLLFTESLIRAGMIPTNSKYSLLLTHSPLSLQITNKEGNTAWTSATVSQVHSKDGLKEALASFPAPIQHENTLLFATDIIGGYALWQEDISDINLLHKELAESVSKLRAANALLAEEEKIKRIAQEEQEKTRLLSQLETEISVHMVKLSTMIEQIENAINRKLAMARITLLLCYVKRRCNLFFREKESARLPADEITVYLDELAEMADYSGVKTIITSELKTELPVRRATLLYDFFYCIIYWATWLEGSRILVHLGAQDGSIVLRLLTAEDAHSFQMERGLEKAIGLAGGIYTVKDIDDEMASISLSFPEGGCA